MFHLNYVVQLNLLIIFLSEHNNLLPEFFENILYEQNYKK